MRPPLESIAAEAGPRVIAYYREIGIPAEAMTLLTEHADADPAPNCLFPWGTQTAGSNPRSF